MPKPGFFVFALLCFLAYPGAVAANSATVEITTGHWPPYLDEGDADQGFVAEIIRAAFAHEGVDVEFSFLPWSRALAMVEAQRYDASAVWSCTEARSQRFIYSVPILPYQYVFYHRARDPFKWTELSDLDGKTIGLTQDYSYGQTLKGLINDGVVSADVTTSDLANFYKLVMGRIDLFPMDPVVGEAMLSTQLNSYASRLSFHPRPLRSAFYHLVFDQESEQARQYKATFNRGFQAIRDNGRYQQIIQAALRENSSPIAARLLERTLVEWDDEAGPCRQAPDQISPDLSAPPMNR